jgi:Tfp pilus assembly protein PilO
MRKLPAILIRRSRAIAAAVSVPIIALVYLLFFSSPVRQWFGLRGELSLKKNELITMEQALRRRELIETLCRKFEQRILARGTDAEELGLLLKELESITRVRKVQVKSIRPMPSQWVGGYREFLVSVEVEGRVQNILELLYSIENSPKILTVKQLKINALRTGPNLLSAGILISRTSAGSKV